MLSFTKSYVTPGLKIKVIANHKYFLDLIDEYCGQEMCKKTGNSTFNITLNIFRRPFKPFPSSNRKDIIHFENSLIDIGRKEIYSYYPSFYMAGQPGILLRPLWCLLYYLGYYPLHAALVKKGKNFLAFFGPSGSGKSTFASFLAQQGFIFICDDHFFIKNTGRYFKIIPFMKMMRVRNAENKEGFKMGELNTEEWRSYFYAQNLIIMFPRYRQERTPRLKRISNKEGILLLMADNLVFRTGQPDNRVGQINMLDFLIRLEKKGRFFEISYNDKGLAQASRLIFGVLRK